MAIVVKKNVPIPGTTRIGENGPNEFTAAILSLKEDGDMFFVPCEGDERNLIQKRLTVRGCKMRSEGKIDFFMISRKTHEVDEVTGETINGVGFWRRAKEEE